MFGFTFKIRIQVTIQDKKAIKQIRINYFFHEFCVEIDPHIFVFDFCFESMENPIRINLNFILFKDSP